MKKQIALFAAVVVIMVGVLGFGSSTRVSAVNTGGAMTSQQFCVQFGDTDSGQYEACYSGIQSGYDSCFGAADVNACRLSVQEDYLDPASPDVMCESYAGATGTPEYEACLSAVQQGFDACASNEQPGACYRQALLDYRAGEAEEVPPEGDPEEEVPEEEGGNLSTCPATGFGGSRNCVSDDTVTTVIIEDNPIYVRLMGIVNFLSVGVGIVSAISVAVAGIQYTASKGDPNKTAAAVNRIVQVAIAIFLYVFGWAILNWIVPGGVL